jgi:type II secretory pathway pseudopilin PulG
MSKKKGFTLIEMAILLVVIGFILATVLPRIISGQKKDLMIESKRIVRTAREEVLGYYIANGTLPDDALFATEVGHSIGRRKGALKYHHSDNWDLNATLPDDGDPGPVAFWVVSPGENHEFEQEYDGPGIDIDYYGENGFDDVVDFVTKEYIQSLKADGPEGGGGGVNISFAENMSDFQGRIRETLSSVIEVDEADQSVVMHVNPGGQDHNDSGCIWYNGDGNGSCPGGVCPFNATLRSYFKFDFNHKGGGLGGVVFAVITDKDNENPCGGDLQTEMGYSGEFPDSSTDSYIDPPKFGLEIDTHKDNSNNDPSDNHVAHVYWGGLSYFDDVKHGAGSDLDGKNPTANSDGVYEQDGVWIENGGEFAARLEMKKNGDQYIEVKAWIIPSSEVDDSSFSNVQEDYAGSAWNIYSRKKILKPENWTDFQNVRFGWTIGAKNKYDVEIKDFAISIR